MRLFGYELLKTSEQDREEKVVQAIAAPDEQLRDSDAVVAGGIHGLPFEIDASRESQEDVINRYRSMLIHQEVDEAVTDICNEAIVYNEDRQPVTLDMSKTKLADSVKDKISDEFEYILDMLNFSSRGHELFKRWYVDSKLCYHIAIDKDKPEQGIKSLRLLDPRRLKKVTRVEEDVDKETGTKVVKGVTSYYIYNQSPLSQSTHGGGGRPVNVTPHSSGISDAVIANDAIINVTSGMTDSQRKSVIGHLHKAIRPLNQLKMMEDSLVIYRFSRAPERLVFYVDVGSLPKTKAEQYVQQLMNRYKTKMIYDANTGTVRSDAAFNTMLENYWMPRREGGKGTEISTIGGNSNLSQIEDIEYFQKKLFKSLNVPISRLEGENGFTLGRASEITRDEVKFARFVDVLRNQFSELFLQALRVQLVLKKIITLKDWEKIRTRINFKYANDSYFTQLKELEILQERLRVVGEIKEYVGVYYTHEYVQTNILGMSDTEIAANRKQTEKEKKDGHYNTETDDPTNTAAQFGPGAARGF